MLSEPTSPMGKHDSRGHTFCVACSAYGHEPAPLPQWLYPMRCAACHAPLHGPNHRTIRAGDLKTGDVVLLRRIGSPGMRQTITLRGLRPFGSVDVTLTDNDGGTRYETWSQRTLVPVAIH